MSDALVWRVGGGKGCSEMGAVQSRLGLTLRGGVVEAAGTPSRRGWMSYGIGSTLRRRDDDAGRC